FPSLMFVTRTPYQAKRRKTLRDRALLALRCLALVLLVLAFAGPEFRGDNPLQAAAADSPATVLLIDRSYSMQPPARWEAALEE
ncbi:BatA domain-containing protein, partial [Klebsiella pneumoniae]